MPRALTIFAAACVLLGPAGGPTVARAAGHGAGASAHGGGRGAARSRRSLGARRHLHRAGALIERRGDGDGYYSPSPSPQRAEYERYFSDPSSTGYIPYCDPGSLYYDPPSCEEMLP